MKRTLMLLLGAAVVLSLTALAFADGDDQGPGGPGYGPGWGYGQHMGPGMMGGYGPGPGPGMMGGYGYGGHMGPGMMGGFGYRGHMGPGMMGGFGGGPGYGMMGGFGGMWGLLQDRLPADKLEQLEKLRYSHMQAMVTQRAQVQSARIALAEVMNSYPLDQEAARTQYATLTKAKQALFDLRVAHMADVQKIVGEELWQELHNGFGPGYGRRPGGPGYGPGHGPGMMGPGTGTNQ